MLSGSGQQSHTEPASIMTIKLYDLTDASREVFFSPYCWRTRMALNHKGLEFESIPWHFHRQEPDRGKKRRARAGHC